MNIFWFNQPSHAGGHAASLHGEIPSETCHLPASCIWLPLSVTLVGSGPLTSGCNIKGWGCSTTLAESWSWAEEESGRLKIMGSSSSTRTFVITFPPVHLLRWAITSYAVLLRHGPQQPIISYTKTTRLQQICVHVCASASTASSVAQAPCSAPCWKSI